MKREDWFYIVFLSTIILARLIVFLFPNNKIIIAGALVHHFFIGFFLLLLGTLILKHGLSRFFLIPIGLGLASDELIYMILGAGPVFPYYWSWYSVLGAIACAAFVFAMRKKIMKKI